MIEEDEQKGMEPRLGTTKEKKRMLQSSIGSGEVHQGRNGRVKVGDGPEGSI